MAKINEQTPSDITGNIQEMQQIIFDYIAFSGGGAKGAIYSGVFAALIKLELMLRVKALAGSSAGAITAAFVATNIDPKEFERISKETNFQSLLGTKGLSLGPVHIQKDGKPLYDLLDRTIRSNFTRFFKKNDDTNIDKILNERRDALEEQIKELSSNNNSSDLQNTQLTSLQTQLKKINSLKWKNKDNPLLELKNRCENEGKIYFKDLTLLNLLEPTQFKNLYITAVRVRDGELVIFNGEDTPNVEIALACRASAALPGVFKPVIIDNEEYVDGGYRKNIPTDIPSKDDIEDLTHDSKKIHTANKQGRVLALAFGSNMDDAANIAVYSMKEITTPGAIIRFLIDELFKMLINVGGTFKYTEEDKKTNENLRVNALDTIVLDTQGISTLSFNDAQKYADYLHIKGYCQTVEYFKNHELGQNIDNGFEYQKFLLNVYEDYNKDNLNKTFSRVVLDTLLTTQKHDKPTWQEREKITNHDNKAKILLSFCKLDKWDKPKELSTILQNFIMISASARNYKISTDTRSINSLIKTLNDPKCPDIIKNGFVKLLDINRNQDPRFSEGISYFKFKPEDFQKFIDKQPKNVNLSPINSRERT